VHAAPPVVPMYVPTAQLTHAVELAAEYLPTAQELQKSTEGTPVATEYVPGGQSLQSVVPMKSWYLAMPQLAHPDWPELAEYMPVLHLEHPAAPVFGLKFPAAHGVQLEAPAAE